MGMNVVTTVPYFIGTGGISCPPLLILKGIMVDQKLRETTITGCMVKVFPTGYISKEIFAVPGERFIEFLDEK